jgi:SAM-dependent methyltransferase
MSSQTSFGLIAPYYDELMKHVPYRMWLGYYLLLLSQQGVKPRKLLDICCGTGTLAELLHEEGFEVAGFDLSQGMIEQARANRPGIRFEVLDAATADMEEQYEGAYSFFDSLNNITELEKLQSAFARAYDHLLPGGSFIFDMNTAYAFEQRMFDQQHLKPGSKLRYKWKGEWDQDKRLISVDMLFWYGKQEFREIHVQRAYDAAEVRQGLVDAGFEDVRCYHSYTLDPPRPTSDRIHWTALKPS